MGKYGTDDESVMAHPTADSSTLFRRVLTTLALSVTITMMMYDQAALDGVIPRMQLYFDISDSTTALLQTLATVTSSIALIVVGAIGDRVEKRFFALLTICLWLLPNILALFVPGNMYWLFVLLRTIAFIGQAILAPLTTVIVGDLFRDRALARALMGMALVVFIGILVSGSISSFFLTSGLPWQMALLPSIAIIVPLFVVLLFAMPQDAPSRNKSRGYIGDIKRLISIKSFVLLVCASSLANIYSKTSSFWMATVQFYAWTAGGEQVYGTMPFPGVMTTYSILALVGSLIGIPFFMVVAESWQYGGALSCGRKYSRVMPFAAGLLQMAGFFVSILNLLTYTNNYLLNLPCHFFATFFGSPMVPMISQLVLTIAPRSQRASAYALMALISGLVGSPSAQIAGMISDAYRGAAEDAKSRFDALAFAFFIFVSFFFAASIMYFLMMRYYPSDVAQREAEEALENPLLPSVEEERRKRGGSIFERSFASRTATMETVYA